MEAKKPTTIDRKTLIPLGLVVTVLGTVIGGAAWLTNINIRVVQLQADVAALENQNNDFSSRIIRVEEKLDGQSSVLEEVRLDVKRILND